MSISTPSIKVEQAYRTNIEVEHAFLHLMYQFRQINNKYGLMVSEQIEQLYENSREEINHCHHYLVHLEKASPDS